MAFTDIGNRIKVNSFDGVDTPGGDGTHGYATPQYAANDSSLDPSGSVFEMVGTFSQATPLDLSNHEFPSNLEEPIVFVSVGAEYRWDGGRASWGANSSIINENTRNNLAFFGFNITGWGNTSNCFLVNDECSFGDLIMDVGGVPASGWAIVCRQNSSVSNVQVKNAYRGISTIHGGNISECDVVAAGDIGIQHAGTGGSVSHSRVQMDGPTGTAFRLREDLTSVTHNIAVATDSADAGFDVGDADFDGTKLAYNFAQGFDVGFEFAAGARAFGVFGNRAFGNGIDFSGEVYAHFNNEVLNAAGLYSDHKSVTPILWHAIPGIGPRLNQRPYFKRRRIDRV